MTDLSELLAPISEAAPCGENLEYDNERMALDSNIQGTPDNQFTGEKAQPPNWRDIRKESVALLRRSKDLQVMLYLIRALIPMEGINGLKDGLSLLEQSLDQFWEHLHPQLDPDDNLDPTLRVNILEELVSTEFILQPISLSILVDSKSVGRFSLRDIQYATDKLPLPDNQNKPDINAIKAAFMDADLGTLTQTYQTINESLTLTQSIESVVGIQVGSTNGPNLEELQSLLKEIRHSFEQMAGSRLTAENVADAEDSSLSETGEISETPSVPSANKTAFVGGKINSRHEAIKALDSICQYYSEYEPSSPVPVLLERAKYLATADFMSIVKNMMPDALGQLEVLKGPGPNQSSDDESSGY